MVRQPDDVGVGESRDAFAEKSFVGKCLAPALSFGVGKLLEVGGVNVGHADCDRRNAAGGIHFMEAATLSGKGIRASVHRLGHSVHEHLLAPRSLVGCEVDVAHPKCRRERLGGFDFARFLIGDAREVAEVGIARGVDQPTGAEAEEAALG